ncbi:MAG: gamma-glutamylcyclotransferase, partial [Acidimicrobiia bacterium]|nr:gamma-glutamylcyclotransferase [Acidimicrobiia bacterium]
PKTIAVEGTTLLYFAYTSLIEPSKLDEVAPGAEFAFIAHLPEWGLGFPYKNGGGGLPSAAPEPGATVWGAVFELSRPQMKAIDQAEKKEGRKPATVEVMDRGGRRHDVTAHLHETNGKKYKPDAAYLRSMVRGSKHWQLPVGWIAGLEEHLSR